MTKMKVRGCWGLKSYNAIPRPKIAQWVELHKKIIIIIKGLSSQQGKKDGKPKSIKKI